MPLNVWVPDRVPELTLAGADRLGAGISGGFGALSQAFQQRQERLKKEAAMGKASKAMLKAMGKDLGLDPMDIDRLSHEDATAQWQGIQGAQHYKQGMQDAELRRIQIEQAKAQAENLKKQPAWMAEVERYKQPGQLPYDIAPEDFERYQLPEGQMEPGIGQMMEAAGRSGYMPTTADVAMMRAAAAARGGAMTPDQAMRAAAAAEEARQKTLVGPFMGELGRYAPPGQLPYDISPEDFERYQLPEGQAGIGPSQIGAASQRTGYNFPIAQTDELLKAFGGGGGVNLPHEIITAPSGMQFIGRGGVTLPAGMDPKTGPRPGATAVHGEDGTLLGHHITNPQGKTVFERAKLPPGLTDAQRLTALSHTLSALYRMPTAENMAEANKVKADMDALTGKGVKPGPAGPAAPAAEEEDFEYQFDPVRGMIPKRKK